MKVINYNLKNYYMKIIKIDKRNNDTSLIYKILEIFYC